MDMLTMRSLIACFCICASAAVFADAPSAEEVLKARLPEIFAKSAAHYKAMAPATEGLSRLKDPNYNITRDSRTPVLVVRQEGEAWTRPFLAVMDPSGTVASVEFAEGEIRVRSIGGKCDIICL